MEKKYFLSFLFIFCWNIFFLCVYLFILFKFLIFKTDYLIPCLYFLGLLSIVQSKITKPKHWPLNERSVTSSPGQSHRIHAVTPPRTETQQVSHGTHVSAASWPLAPTSNWAAFTPQGSWAVAVSRSIIHPWSKSEQKNYIHDSLFRYSTVSSKFSASFLYSVRILLNDTKYS